MKTGYISAAISTIETKNISFKALELSSIMQQIFKVG